MDLSLENIGFMVVGAVLAGPLVLIIFACLTANRCQECEHERLLKEWRQRLH